MIVDIDILKDNRRLHTLLFRLYNINYQHHRQSYKAFLDNIILCCNNLLVAIDNEDCFGYSINFHNMIGTTIENLCFVYMKIPSIYYIKTTFTTMYLTKGVMVNILNKIRTTVMDVSSILNSKTS